MQAALTEHILTNFETTFLFISLMCVKNLSILFFNVKLYTDKHASLTNIRMQLELNELLLFSCVIKFRKYLIFGNFL